MKDYSEIINKPDVPFLKLKGLDVPYEKMTNEINSVMNIASSQSSGGWIKKWKAITLHGLGVDKPRPHTAYGFIDEDDAEYNWTSVARKCPTIVSFIESNFGYDKLYRVKVNIMEPGGRIKPHRDSRDSILGYTLPSKSHIKYLTIAIKWPENVPFFVEKYDIDVKNGDVFLIDFSNIHAVYNNSNEVRYSLIVAMDIDNNDKWKKLVCDSYELSDSKNYKKMSSKQFVYHSVNGWLRNVASTLKRYLGKGYSN